MNDDEIIEEVNKIFPKKRKKFSLSEYNKRTERFFQTQSHNKLINYFQEIITQKDFSNIREKWNIPKNGFKMNEDSIKIIPEEWSHKDNPKYLKEINEFVIAFSAAYYLHYLDFGEIIKMYLFYNEFIVPKHSNAYNLCLLENILEKKEESIDDDKEIFDDFCYPIAIRISPYASQRDILDYVKKVFPTIKDWQKSYKSNDCALGKIRTRDLDIQKRNEYIYKNKHLPIKVIAKKLAEKNKKWHLDQGHISKILSLERKKRKEV